MNRKVKWGVVTFIILIIGVSAVLLMRRTDPKPPITIYRGDTEPLNPNPTLNTKDNPPPTEAGFKWVWHDNHWDKVPIAQTNGKIQHDGPHAPVNTSSVPPQSPLKYISNVPIPEDMPMPDIPLPVDLKNMDWQQWSQKHRTEWLKYVHALDPVIERIGREVETLRANMPPENSPDYAVWRAKSNPKILEYDQLIDEKGRRIHQWDDTREAAFEKYCLARFGKKPYE